MIIVDNVVVSEKKFKTIKQRGLSACKQKNISDKAPVLPPDTWNVLKWISFIQLHFVLETLITSKCKTYFHIHCYSSHSSYKPLHLETLLKPLTKL